MDTISRKEVFFEYWVLINLQMINTKTKKICVAQTKSQIISLHFFKWLIPTLSFRSFSNAMPIIDTVFIIKTSATPLSIPKIMTGMLYALLDSYFFIIIKKNYDSNSFIFLVISVAFYAIRTEFISVFPDCVPKVSLFENFPNHFCGIFMYFSCFTCFS